MSDDSLTILSRSGSQGSSGEAHAARGRNDGEVAAHAAKGRKTPARVKALRRAQQSPVHADLTPFFPKAAGAARKNRDTRNTRQTRERCALDRDPRNFLRMACPASKPGPSKTPPPSGEWCGRGDSNSQGCPAAPKAAASTNSATAARGRRLPTAAEETRARRSSGRVPTPLRPCPTATLPRERWRRRVRSLVGSAGQACRCGPPWRSGMGHAHGEDRSKRFRRLRSIVGHVYAVGRVLPLQACGSVMPLIVGAIGPSSGPTVHVAGKPRRRPPRRPHPQPDVLKREAAGPPADAPRSHLR